MQVTSRLAPCLDKATRQNDGGTLRHTCSIERDLQNLVDVLEQRPPHGTRNRADVDRPLCQILGEGVAKPLHQLNTFLFLKAILQPTQALETQMCPCRQVKPPLNNADARYKQMECTVRGPTDCFATSGIHIYIYIHIAFRRAEQGGASIRELSDMDLQDESSCVKSIGLISVCSNCVLGYAFGKADGKTINPLELASLLHKNGLPGSGRGAPTEGGAHRAICLSHVANFRNRAKQYPRHCALARRSLSLGLPSLTMDLPTRISSFVVRRRTKTVSTLSIVSLSVSAVPMKEANIAFFPI